MTFEEFTQSVIDFVRVNKIWAPLIVAGLAFGESLAFISLLLPATVILVGVGALIGATGISSCPSWSARRSARRWAIGFPTGWAFGSSTRSQKCGRCRAIPTLMPRGHAFVERYGFYAVFIGRFFGPLRASVPLAAGILEMPWWPFQIANFASAFLWAAMLLTLGDGMTIFFRWLLGID